ncbi:hypothetical protein GOBAR_DD08940 [Gossypium barbadense]|nr:hypothetical protein GOBAR_DD08940 [Gossypium barbadense]
MSMVLKDTKLEVTLPKAMTITGVVVNSTENENEKAQTQPYTEVKLFNWSFQDLEVLNPMSSKWSMKALVPNKSWPFCLLKTLIGDISLSDYIGVHASKHATYVPHTAGRYLVKRFRKAQCPIVKRLAHSLMMHGRNNGKKLIAVRIIKHAMEIVYLLTDQNPIQVIADAIVNRQVSQLSMTLKTFLNYDATSIGSAGVVRRQAVDISPLRPVNEAIYLITTGARESAFRNIKSIAGCLADELIKAAKGSSNRCYNIKNDEIERVAKANS